MILLIISVALLINNGPIFSKQITIENRIVLWKEIVEYYRNDSRSHLLLPLGRPYSIYQDIDIYVNDEDYEVEIITDICGAYWANLSLDLFENESEIVVERTNRQRSLILYHEKGQNNISLWLSPSTFIDSDNQFVINLAKTLNNDKLTRLENAELISNYVYSQIKYKDPNVSDLNASKVYDLGYGVCEDKARLFIALCRAVKIPARAITGFISIDKNPIDNLHMWAEILDEEGYWHPVCPTNKYFDFFDVKFFDYRYAYHQNPFRYSYLNQTNSTSIPHHLINDKTKVKSVIWDEIKVLELLMNSIFWGVVCGISIEVISKTIIQIRKFISKKYRVKQNRN